MRWKPLLSMVLALTVVFCVFVPSAAVCGDTFQYATDQTQILAAPVSTSVSTVTKSRVRLNGMRVRLRAAVVNVPAVAPTVAVPATNYSATYYSVAPVMRYYSSSVQLPMGVQWAAVTPSGQLNRLTGAQQCLCNCNCPGCTCNRANVNSSSAPQPAN